VAEAQYLYCREYVELARLKQQQVSKELSSRDLSS
jgi:hypothetical protein